MTTIVEVLEQSLISDPDAVVYIHAGNDAMPTATLGNAMPGETRTVMMPQGGTVVLGHRRVAVFAGDTLAVTSDNEIVVNGKVVL